MKGYVVRIEREFGPSDGSKRLIVSWWYGPDHGWGTTSSTNRDDTAIKVFTNRLSAENALRRVYGSVASANRRGYKVVSEERRS